MTFPPEVWSGVLRRLEEKLPAFTYEAWVTPLVLGDVRSDRIIVLCPTLFHRDRVRISLRDSITEAISDELGRCPTIDFDVADMTERSDASVQTGDRQAEPTDAAVAGAPLAQMSGERGTTRAPFPRTLRPGAAREAATSEQQRPHLEAPRSDETAGPLAGVLAEATSRLKIQPRANEDCVDTRYSGPPQTGPSASLASASPATAPASASPATAPASASPATPLASVDPATTHHRVRSVRPGHAPARSGHARTALRANGTSQPELPYSFGNFVVGPCNALAREAAFAVAGGQQMALQQLYLASPTGLGKTHLARAIAAEVARTSGRTVRYATAEVFTSEFVSALRNKRTPEFKRRYRPERGGLLVLEDVQFLAAKRATQLEFFHSVQHVLDAGGRVVLTGDRMPQEMKELDERLREQLAGGFVAALEPPDPVMRRQILKTKAAHGAIALPDACLDLLVESVGGSVRELESVLMQVVTTSTLLKRPIDLELTRRSIAQKVQPITPRAKRPGIEDVLAVVAAFFQTSPEMLAARSRKRAVLVPRQLAMYLCHRHTDTALADIGRALGRDHPSVRNAIKKVEREMLENPKLRYQVEALTTRIQERMG